MTQSVPIGTKEIGATRGIPRENADCYIVPRDGIEPSTRGFSVLVQRPEFKRLGAYCSKSVAVALTTFCYRMHPRIPQFESTSDRRNAV